MFRIAVVDDDEIVLNKICQFIIESFLESVEIDKFVRSNDFLKLEEKKHYNFIFIDINMPQINGFKLAGYLNTINSEAKIIFVSSFEHLVFQSLKFKPFRFVRKSQLQHDILSAVNDYQNEILKSRDMSYFQTIDSMINVLTTNIVYFESMSHELYVQTVDDKFKLKRERIKEISMKTLEDKYAPKGFIRVHKSFIVNCRYIHKIDRKEIILKNGLNISINPHKVNEIKNLYQNYLISGD